MTPLESVPCSSSTSESMRPAQSAQIRRQAAAGTGVMLIATR